MASPENERVSPPELGRLRTAHVVFFDIVGYSKLTTDAQSGAVRQLESMVRELPGYAEGLAANELISIPTGDGMAIACFGDPTVPVRFARDLASRVRREAPFALRIGLHNGPVYCSPDINANMNVAGGGINIAQRIMDCGDGGHILLSQSVADTLLQLNQWKDAVQDLGECEVKHGLRLRIFNLSTPEFGNANLPTRLLQSTKAPDLTLVGKDLSGNDPAPTFGSLPPPEPPPSEAGFAIRTVLQYRLLEKLGAGGMGEVYKARDTRLNRFVAMKVLPAGMAADPERRRRFVHEAQAASALNHPNIITIYDIVNDGDTQYMVVEYVDGKTLLELTPKDGLPVPQAIQYASQMVEALGAAHAAVIVHRDLKPANVMVTGTGLVKLLDFGLAKLVVGKAWEVGEAGDYNLTVTAIEAPLTIEGSVMGTVNYMSPEQAEGKKVDARSDIFSFGAVFYEMLTGRRAFRGGSTLSTLTAVLRDDVQPIVELKPDVPLDLERIVQTCLRKDPAQRYQSMREIYAALAPLRRLTGPLYGGLSLTASSALDDAPTVRTPIGLVPPRPQPSGSRASKAMAVGIACFLVLAAAGGGAYWWMNRPSQPASAPATSTPGTAATVAPAAPVVKAPPPTPAPPPAPVTVPVVLGDALPIRLILAEDVPHDAAEGDPVRFTVSHAVRVDDTVVIPKGAEATGFIVDGAKKKIFGIGGKMTFRLKSVAAVNGQRVTIRATPDGKSSKRQLKPATAGAEYVGYTDGSNTVTVKR